MQAARRKRPCAAPAPVQHQVQDSQGWTDDLQRLLAQRFRGCMGPLCPPVTRWRRALGLILDASRSTKAALRSACASTASSPRQSGLDRRPSKATCAAISWMYGPVMSTRHALAEGPGADLRCKPLDESGLAQRLRQYSIKSKTVRVGPTTFKGYLRSDFVDVWARYVHPSPATSVTSVTAVTNSSAVDPERS